MFIDSKWGELPHLVLTQIYSHLTCTEDRLSAASVNWQWRHVIFQPRFFQATVFQVSRQNEPKNVFYLENLSHLCNTITIRFNPQTSYGVEKTLEILKKINENNCAQRLILRPKYGTFLLLAHHRHFLDLLWTFLANRPLPLRLLDMGGIQTDDLSYAIHPGHQMQTLSLATSQPFHYAGRPVLPSSLLDRFRNLRNLSLDYGDFSDDWLVALEGLRFLLDLTLHVHSAVGEYSHQGTSNGAWQRLVAKNPTLRLHLTLIHAYEAVQSLHTDVLCPAMPLSHLKILFCEHLNTTAIEYLSNYAGTLKSLVWVDVGCDSIDLFDDFAQDPFVMLAWQCKLLQELVINGYLVEALNVVGVARLRGETLSRLEVSGVEWTPQLVDEVSKQMGRGWTPLPKTRLNSIFTNEGKYNLQLQEEYVMRSAQKSFGEGGI